MPRSSAHDDFDSQYSLTLTQLRMLAQQDLADWWANTSRLAPPVRMDTLRDAFYAIQATYGEQAAHAAANHLFLSRSLDESLSGLEFPAAADPASYEQARAAFNWATVKYRESFALELLPIAQDKLAGVLNRLVVQPAHDTIAKAVVTAGTGYARLPEPGACIFCLMLASRGAAYSKESVQSANGYHDNCRCVGIEVKNDDELPRINRELHELWQATSKKIGETPTDRQFQEALIRYRNKTPDWIPFDAERVNATPGNSRGRKESVKSIDELQRLGLVDHPSTLREKQPSKQALEIWEKEERIIQWITSKSYSTEIHRVTPSKEGSSPDFIVDGITVDGKTVNAKRIEQRVSDGSSQAQAVVVDTRGKSASDHEIRKRLKSSVRNHGDRLDMIVVITDTGSYFWEGVER